MHTLHFESVRDDLVPGIFEGEADIALTPAKVCVLPSAPTGKREVTFLYHSTGADWERLQASDERPLHLRVLTAAEKFRVEVRGAPAEHMVVLGTWRPENSDARSAPWDYAVPLQRLQRSVRRFHLQPGAPATMLVAQPRVISAIEKVTIESDAEGDVQVTSLFVANWACTQNTVPVELFRAPGLSFRSGSLMPTSKIRIDVRAAGQVERWVEVSLEMKDL